MTSPMTLDEARGYLARAVMTKGPEFVYRLDPKDYDRVNNPLACSYFPRTDLPEDDPRHCTACLIGVALRLAGREITQWMEGLRPKDTRVASAWNLSWAAGNYFTIAQDYQDQGSSWGDAYEKVERWATGYILYPDPVS